MIVKGKNGEGFLDLRICDNLELMAEIKDNTIDLIYCDILYGTGRKFKDYQDLKPIRSEIETHYISRIKEMYRILKPTGSIYLQMDWRISHWVRCMMDDIFGYDNFKNTIVWCYGAGGGHGKKYFRRTHDDIHFYTKTNQHTFNKQLNQYGSSLQDWWNIKGLQDKSGFFQNDDERQMYQTQKPKALIERIIKASSNEGDLVADFYSGSFTTAEVCKDLKRNFIGCDINPNCFEKAKERGLFSFTDLPTNVD
ncbi:MAG TPA: site-specific DNA-methyltransferase [Treponemataceae bacterium]|nr:site-specific DNA-methyltransferase [Treponemataceae bacterium]